ncbi:MAG: inverse autotransporter beta domain-containing protein [Verrucomicrobiales bacterium]|nr:inverse autotransporter beta domain-containing protein [Verrucomicrobiales bacterium]
MIRLQLYIISLFFLVGGVTTSVFGQESTFDWSTHNLKWHGTLNGEFKAGEARHLSQVGITLPLFQNDFSMLFTDLRVKVDDLHNEEANLGLAFRTLVNSDWILGAYGFFDRLTTQSGNDYDGATFGVELMSERWDFRVNGYLSESDIRDGGPVGFLPGRRFEEAVCEGIDYEMGRLLLTFGDSNELRGYVGGFHYQNDNTRFADLTGPRGRLELRLFDVVFLGEGSRVTFSGEILHDDTRKTDAFGGVQVQIPLGGTREGSLNPFGASDGYQNLSRLERRMLDPIRLDLEILAKKQVAPGPRRGPLD